MGAGVTFAAGLLWAGQGGGVSKEVTSMYVRGTHWPESCPPARGAQGLTKVDWVTVWFPPLLETSKVRLRCDRIGGINVQGENNSVSSCSVADAGGNKRVTAIANINGECRGLDGGTSEEGQSSGEEKHYVC